MDPLIAFECLDINLREEEVFGERLSRLARVLSQVTEELTVQGRKRDAYFDRFGLF